MFNVRRTFFQCWCRWCKGTMLLVFFFVSRVIARLSKKSFVWFNTTRDEDRPLLATLSLAWPLCGLKSLLQSLKNSWGRLVRSMQEWVNCDRHFGHRFSESKSLFHWSWHYQVVQTRVTVSNFLFQTTLTWTIKLFHLLIKWLLIRGSNALISSKATCKRTQQLQTMLRPLERG